MADSSPEVPAWTEERRRVHADCRVFTVERRTLRHPEKPQAHDFFVVCPSDWAVAMALTPEGRWVMVRQFRFGTGHFVWEFPSGCCERGETAVDAAARELREESGYVGEDPVVLGVTEPNPAIQDNRCTFVLFRGARPAGAPRWDEHEEMEIATMDHQEVCAAARDGRMAHALMHAGLFLYEAWRQDRG